jgi:Putative auto-transporter adhesin, head GIN domain
MAITTAPHRSGHPAHHGQPIMIAVLIAALAVVTSGIVLLLVYGGSSNSGVQGSGAAASQTRTVAAFSSLDLTGSNNVTIIVGQPQSVVVHADSNMINHVTTDVTAGTLVIGDTGSLTSGRPVSVDVRVPSLTALTLSGSGQISATAIKTPQLTVTVYGSGLLSAAGTATRLDVTINGSGQAKLSQLTARDVHAVINGSGLIQVTATTSLDAAVPGSGAIIYSGNPPQVITSVTGSGTVTRG